MTPPMSLNDLFASAPLTVVTLVALAMVVIDAVSPAARRLEAWLAILGLAAAAALALATIGETGTAYAGMVTTGGYANYVAALFAIAGALSVMLSQSYLARLGISHGEFYVLLVLAVAGMILMGSAANLVIFFLGLELMSVCFYVLAGFARARPLSNEAALKYFLLGAFATGFLLYGIALVYGTTGTTVVARIRESVGLAGEDPLFLIGLALLLVGLAFKVAAVPFHMWVPDVYEGSPTTVSGFMSTGGKAAAFSAFLLVFAPAFARSVGSFREILAVLAALSMIVGNIVALAQPNIKRMLAYSSIAHAGYILTGVVAANSTGASGVLFYLVAYTVMNIGAFGVVSIVESTDGGRLHIEEYGGLGERRPLLAGLMAVFMFSLTGIPPFAGFFGKYYVFAGAVEGGYTWLAIVGVLMSVVSAYYYLRIVVMMYFREGGADIEVAIPALGLAALIVSALGLLGFGLFPSVILNLTAHFF